jgi:hypothetical protein
VRGSSLVDLHIVFIFLFPWRLKANKRARLRRRLGLRGEVEHGWVGAGSDNGKRTLPHRHTGRVWWSQEKLVLWLFSIVALQSCRIFFKLCLFSRVKTLPVGDLSIYACSFSLLLFFSWFSSTKNKIRVCQLWISRFEFILFHVFHWKLPIMFLLREPITFFLSLTKLKNLDLNNTLVCAALIAHDLLTARGKLLLPADSNTSSNRKWAYTCSFSPLIFHVIQFFQKQDSSIPTLNFTIRVYFVSCFSLNYANYVFPARANWQK